MIIFEIICKPRCKMKQDRLVWAIDCDDVVVPTAQALIDAYNERYGLRVPLEAFNSGDDPSLWGVSSPREARQRVNRLLEEGIAFDIAPTGETIEALTRLAAVDELHMVTGRLSSFEEATLRMLDTHLPGVFRTVEHTNFFNDEGSGLISRTKGEVCAAIGADVLIDDHMAHAQSVLDYGLKEVIVWGNYPWNRTQKLGGGIVRCVAWEEVFRERERILGNRK